MSLDEITAEIEKSINARTLLPTRAADLIVILGVKYARAVDNYMVAKAEYAKAFTTDRANHKSDTACERAIDYTETGLTLSHWKYQTRKCEMLVNSLKSFVYQKSAESRNEQ